MTRLPIPILTPAKPGYRGGRNQQERFLRKGLTQVFRSRFTTGTSDTGRVPIAGRYLRIECGESIVPASLQYHVFVKLNDEWEFVIANKTNGNQFVSCVLWPIDYHTVQVRTRHPSAPAISVTAPIRIWSGDIEAEKELIEVYNEFARDPFDPPDDFGGDDPDGGGGGGGTPITPPGNSGGGGGIVDQ